MQRQIDALVVRALAEQAAAQGVQSHLVAQALRIAEKMEGSDLHVRTLRDAAASWRAIADAEIETIRRAKAEESLKKLKDMVS